MARPPAALTAALVPTAERLLEAAEPVFGASGFAAARLEDIAAAAGIRRPSLLHHFPSKEALYAAVVARAFAHLGEALQRAMASGGGFAAQLDAMIAGYLDFLAGRPAFAALVLRDVIDGRGPGRELLLGEVAPLLDRVEAFVRAGRPDVPVRAAILQVACAPLVRAAAGPAGARLWGEGPDATAALARALLLPGPTTTTDRGAAPRRDG
ncbi:MAG: TetR/AcrR family transcriptional regulator [Planctomycetes bacterium]|nr:TetR/AcrR family transcriptional regulator [Planctomycetota bacterium]